MKYLFITLEIQDGERVHTHRVLETTNCKNINFAAEYYAAHYWGYGERTFKDMDNHAWFFHGDEIAIDVENVKELTKSEFDYVYNLFYGFTQTKDDTTILHPVDDNPKDFSDAEIEEFKQNWGQSESEVCSALSLDEEEAGAFLVNDYFYLEDEQKWYEKFSSIYSEKEQEIADYLKCIS